MKPFLVAIISNLCLLQSLYAVERYEDVQPIDEFEISCNTSETHNTFYRYEDGILAKYTLNEEGGRNELYSAQPNEVHFANREDVFDSGSKVAWEEIKIRIEGSSRINDEAMGEPEYMTIVLRTEKTSGELSWEEVNIEKQRAFLDSDGYLSSAFYNENEMQSCSLER